MSRKELIKDIEAAARHYASIPGGTTFYRDVLSFIEELTDERDRYKRYYFNHCFDELRANVEADVRADTVRAFMEKHAEAMRLFTGDSTDFTMKWCEYEVATESVAEEVLEGSP